jgi:hypothetical protein
MLKAIPHRCYKISTWIVYHLFLKLEEFIKTLKFLSDFDKSSKKPILSSNLPIMFEVLSLLSRQSDNSLMIAFEVYY